LRPVKAKVGDVVAVVAVAPAAGVPEVAGWTVAVVVVVVVVVVALAVKVMVTCPFPDWLAPATEPFELDGSKKLDPPPPPPPDDRDVLDSPPPPPPPK